jgi:hypothetical protein
MFYYLKLMAKIKKLIIWLRELRDKVRRNKKYCFIE